MARSPVDAISPAFEQMRRQLFAPFRWGQWWRFAFVGFLTAESASGGCNMRAPFPPPTPSPGSTPTIPDFPSLDAFIHSSTFLISLACVAVGLVLFVIVFTYIASRMRFVLFDSLIAGECRIREFWKARGDEGWRYFGLQLVLIVVAIAMLFVVFGIPLLIAGSAGWLDRPAVHAGPLILLVILAALLLVACFLTVGIVSVLVKDFVVPQMALESMTVRQAWRQMWAYVRAEKGAFAGYLAIKIVMAICAGFIFGVIALMLILIVLIPVGGIGILSVGAASMFGMSWSLWTIAVVAVLAFCAMMFIAFLGAIASVPVIVFFPAYGLHFFAERYAPLKAAMTPP